MNYQGYTIGLGTLALINAGLAQTKNRDAFGWFFLTLFIGPVATFLLVVLNKLPENYERKPIGIGNFLGLGLITGLLITLFCTIFISNMFQDINQFIFVGILLLPPVVCTIGGYLIDLKRKK